MQIVGAVGAGLMLLILLVFWKLSDGPLSLPQLTPYVSEAISAKELGLKLNIGSTQLVWAGWKRTLDLRVVDVQVVGRDQEVLLEVPTLSVSLSAQALMKGVVAPRSLEIFDPTINVIRREDGVYSLEVGAKGKSVALSNEAIAKLLVGDNDPTKPWSYLRRLTINGATVEFADRKNYRNISFPNADFSLLREGGSLLGDFNADLVIEGGKSELALTMTYDTISQNFNAGLSFGDLLPSEFASYHPLLSELERLSLPLSGTLTVDGTLARTDIVQKIDFDLQAGHGVIAIPAPAEQLLNLEKATLQGSWNALENTVSLTKAYLVLDAGEVVSIPAPISHDMAIRSLDLSGRYEIKQGMLKLDPILVNLEGDPHATASLVVTGLGLEGEPMTLEFQGNVFDMPTNELPRFWPPALGSDAHAWVANHMSEGVFPKAGVYLSLILDANGEISSLDVSGDIDIKDVRVDYLPPMTAVDKAFGHATFDAKSFSIFVEGGMAGDLAVHDGKLLIYDLNTEDPRMNVDVVVDGSLPNSLRLIDAKPLGFASALGIKPNNTGGKASTRVKLDFPLLNDLQLDQVNVTAHSEVSQGKIKNAALGLDVQDAKLQLDVDKKGMDVKGQITLGTMPASLFWRENFIKKSPFASRFELAGVLDEAQRTTELGLDFPPFTSKYLSGDTQVSATITRNWDKKTKIEVAADISEAEVRLPLLEWEKKAGEIGEASVTLLVEKEVITQIPAVHVTAGDLELKGSLSFDAKKGSLKALDIEQFDVGRSKIEGGTVLAVADGGWEVDVHGPSLDLTPILEKLDGSSSEQTETNKSLKGTYSGRFATVWLGEDRNLQNVVAAATSNGTLWQRMKISGTTTGQKAFDLSVQPRGDNRYLEVMAEDAGEVLRQFDMFDKMLGGKLKIGATFNDTVPSSPLVGRVDVLDYRVKDLPVMAQVLNIASLTGIVESLNGEGISFTTLDVPFKFENDLLEIKEARANGISLGFTASGKIYTNASVVDINGTIVPMYALNSFLGNIPILGSIFTGGETGGGIFAANYSITGPQSDPKVSVNPLSALTPGFLRRIFDIGTKESPPPQGNGAKAPATTE